MLTLKYHKIMTIKYLILSMRPKQWYKNIVVFAALIFSHNLFDKWLILDSVFAFVIFCMLSGSVYIINDIIDRKKDCLHPIKKNRPIASGKLRYLHTIIFLILILSSSLILAFVADILFGYISLTYFLLFLAYSLVLKHIVIIDILTIAAGFVIRAMAGAIIINTVPSPWLIICTLLLAIFLALGKRRHELLLLGDDAGRHRPILDNYSVIMLEQMISSTIAAIIISYSMYTFMIDNRYMMFTIPFVIYGLFKYLQIIHIDKSGGEPELILSDKGMIANIILWVTSILIILYI